MQSHRHSSKEASIRRIFRHISVSMGFAFVLLCQKAYAQQGEHPEFLLRSGHPRLMFLESDFEHVRQFIKDDPQARRWHENLLRKAREMLDEPPAEHILIGPRMLAQSRLALDRISLLAALYRIDGDKSFAEGARKELLAVSAFPNWNPSHFLDVAEMTNACGIGYDWLYDYLSPKDRQTISGAIINLGLHPGLDLLESHTGFSRMTNNWSQVCNGGLSVGALAIADDDPDLSNRVLSLARQAVTPAMQTFLAPDGGCIEGPGYWSYATIYTAYYLSALRTALNTDFGFDASPGLADAGMFRVQDTGPLGKLFNFADSSDRSGDAPQMFFLANLFHRPFYAQWERKLVGDRGSIFDLLWASEGPGRATTAPGTAEEETAPLGALFRGINTAFFRTSWTDRNAIFVGFKGGYNGASHAHLDLGTFVLDALGQRWAIELGSDDYNLPGYFDGKKMRWTYYRLGTAGQNTLLINHANQSIGARAGMVAFKSTPDESYAVVNLTAAYPQADQIRRGIGIFDRRRVVMLDEISLHQLADVTWQMHTRASIELRGREAILRQGGKTLFARILSPANVVFSAADATAPPPNNPNRGVRKLLVQLHPVGPVRLSIIFDIANPDKPMFPQDLQEWVDDSPVR